jgi:hypothetical protein
MVMSRKGLSSGSRLNAAVSRAGVAGASLPVSLSPWPKPPVPLLLAP